MPRQTPLSWCRLFLGLPIMRNIFNASHTFIPSFFCRFYHSNMFPENLVQACFQGIQTEYEYKPIPVPPAVNGTLVATTVSSLSLVSDAALSASNATGVAAPLMKLKRVLVYRDGMNVLGKLTDYHDNINNINFIILGCFSRSGRVKDCSSGFVCLYRYLH